MSNRGLRWTIVVAFLVLAIGAAVRALGYAAQSAATMEYTDWAQAMSLFNEVGQNTAEERQAAARAYFALQTDKWPLRHQSESWLALALTLGTAGLAAAIVTARNGDILSTPQRSLPVFTLLAVALLAVIPFSIWYYARAVEEEHCCLWFADTIGLPIVGTGAMALVLLAVSAIYFLPLIRNKRLPASLLRPITRLRFGLVLWVVYLVPPTALFGYIALAGLADMAVLVPLGAIGLWTTLVALASALKPYQGGAT